MEKKILTLYLSEFKICSLYPYSMHVVTFTFHYQLMHLLIKNTSRHHTDRYIANIHVQTTYRHRLECDGAGMLTLSNCARYGDGPLMMVGGLTETCWVF